MPLGTPGRPAPAPAAPRSGTDWAVVVPIVALPIVLTSAVLAGSLAGWTDRATLVLGAATLVCIALLVAALLHGGWPRVRAAFRGKPQSGEEKPDRVEVLSRGPAWKRAGTLLFGLAVLGFGIWGQVTGSMKAHYVIKALLVGGAAVTVALQSMARARKGEVGR